MVAAFGGHSKGLIGKAQQAYIALKKILKLALYCNMEMQCSILVSSQLLIKNFIEVYWPVTSDILTSDNS